METHSKVLFIGDMHLGDVNFNLDKELINVIKSDDFDKVIIGGDAFDLWRADNLAEVMIKYRNFIDCLSKEKTIFIKGNHDTDLGDIEKSGFVVKEYYEYLTDDGKKVKVLHGHEFDKYRKWLMFLGRVLCFFEENTNKLLKFFRAPIALRFVKFGLGLDRTAIWLALRRKHYLYNNSDILVFGHTHTPMHGTIKSTRFYNWGSWQRDRGYPPSYIINEGKNFKIEYLKTRNIQILFHFISLLNHITDNYVVKGGAMISNTISTKLSRRKKR